MKFQVIVENKAVKTFRYADEQSIGIAFAIFAKKNGFTKQVHSAHSWKNVAWVNPFNQQIAVLEEDPAVIASQEAS